MKHRDLTPHVTGSGAILRALDDDKERTMHLSTHLKGTTLAALMVLGLAMPYEASAQGNSGKIQDRQCIVYGLPGSLVLGDPEAYYSTVGGYLDGRKLAYKIEGEFPHSATYTWTGYNSYGLIDEPDWVLDDYQIKPDKGSVNPFVPGNDVFAKQRKYTMWGWPASVPVPNKLRDVSVFKYGDVIVDPADLRGRHLLELRFYKQFPGYRPFRELPKITVYDVTNGTGGQALKKSISCIGLGSTGGLLTANRMYQAALEKWGSDPVPKPQDPKRITFVRMPKEFVILAEGYNADNSLNYLASQIDASRIGVLTVHKTPSYFDTKNLSVDSIFGVDDGSGGYDAYEGRYQSILLQTQFPIRDEDQIDATDAIYQPDGSWVTVVLPQDPVLDPDDAERVRAKAAQLGFKVIGGAPLQPNLGLQPGLIAYRSKVPKDGFRGDVKNVPSWLDPFNPETADNELKDWTNQTSDEFFDTYSSTYENMGPYYIDGVSETLEEFLAR